MSDRRYSWLNFLLFGALAAAVVAQFHGASWGTPSLRRTTLAFGSLAEVQRVLPELLASRVRLQDDYAKAVRAHQPLTPEQQRAMISKSPSNLWTMNSPVSRDHVLESWRAFLSGVPSDDQQTLSALSRLWPWKGAIDPQNYSYGLLYFGTVGAWLQAARWMGLIPRDLSMPSLLLNPEGVSRLYVAARSWSAWCNTITALLLFLALTPLIGIRWSLAGSLFFLGSPLSDVMSHLAKPHALAAMLATAGGLRWIQDRHGWSTAVFWGLSAAALMPYGILLLFLLVPSTTSQPFRRRLALFGTGAAFALLFNPLPLLEGGAFRTFVAIHHGSGYQQGSLHLYESVAFLQQFSTHGFPWTLWPLAAAGTWLTISWRDRSRAAILSLAAMTFFLINLLLVRHSGLALWPLAMCCVAAACGGSALARRSVVQRRLSVSLATVTLILMAAFRWQGRFRYVREGNLTHAAAWINAHLPAGSSIGVLAKSLNPSTVPPFLFSRYTIWRIDDTWRGKQTPDYRLVVHDADPIQVDSTYPVIAHWPARPRRSHPFLWTHDNRSITVWRTTNE